MAELFICEKLAVTVRLARFVSVVPKFMVPDRVTVPVSKSITLVFPLFDKT